MALHFGGEFLVQRSPEEVYDFLIDPNRFGSVLPYFQGLTVADEKNFEVKVRVGISHIRGIANVRLNRAEAERPRRLLYRGKGSLAGGSVDFTAGFDLAMNEEGTRVAWRGEVQVFGVLTSIAGGLLQPLAQKNAQKAIDGLQAALGQIPSVSALPAVSPLPVVSSPSAPVVSEPTISPGVREPGGSDPTPEQPIAPSEPVMKAGQ
jgi:carbon monoxide dehydrogenase subunit G